MVGVHCGPGVGGVEALQGLAKLGTRADDQAVSSLVARAVHLVIEVERDEDGTRRVNRISEITGANGKSVVTQELFVYDGSFTATGNKASFTS
jgi:Flp pilus assembly CpaF family ATPase